MTVLPLDPIKPSPTSSPGSSSAAAGPTDSSPLPPVITVAEFADFLRVERKTVYARIAAGGVPGVQRVGRILRIHRDTVLRWLTAGGR